MASLDSLSDQEIRSRLTALGCEVGPVTPTTRKVYLRKLKTALEENNQSIDSHDARSPQRPSSFPQNDNVLQDRKATPRQKSPVTKRKSPSRKADVLPPLASSTFVDSPSKPHISRTDVPRPTRIVPDTSRKIHINFDIVPSNDEPSVPKVQNDYYSYPKTSYTSENVPSSRLKYSSSLSKDFDSSQPYTSDFTRHLSNLSASRVAAATSMINQRMNVSSKLFDNVKESDDEDEGSEPTYTKFGSKGSSVRRNGSIYNFQRESWFGKDSSVIILLVLGLFFVIIAYTYINIHHSPETSVSSHVSELIYPKCDGYQPQGSCIPEHEVHPVTVVFRLVHKELEEMAKNRGCNPSDTPFLYNMDIVKLVTDNEKSMSVWDVEKYVAHVKLLIKSNPDWNMIQTPEGVRLKQIPGSMYCTMVSYFLILMNWALQLSLVVLGGALVYWGGRWWMKREARRKDQLFKLVGDILEVVNSKASQDGFVVISHVRDMLIPLKDRQKMAKLWSEAEAMLESDSRLRKEVQQVEGEDFLVWRWLAAPPSLKRKGWQGQAFGTMEGSVNSLPESPTSCLKIRHMFDPSQEEGEGWVNAVADAILEKCKDAVIHHIVVDRNSQEGCVYVKCASQQDAGVAYRALHGFWFDSKLVTVKYIREARYLERFPSSVNARIPLQASSRSGLK